MPQRHFWRRAGALCHLEKLEADSFGEAPRWRRKTRVDISLLSAFHAIGIRDDAQKSRLSMRFQLGLGGTIRGAMMQHGHYRATMRAAAVVMMAGSSARER